METLRGKLAEKTRELEKAEKTITMLRDAVSRAEKDKAGLHSRLKRYVTGVLYLFIFSLLIILQCGKFQRSVTRFFHQTAFVVGCSSSKSVVGGPPLVTNEVVQDLKQNIYKLEEEVSLLLKLTMIWFRSVCLVVLYTSDVNWCLPTATPF